MISTIDSSNITQCLGLSSRWSHIEIKVAIIKIIDDK